MSLSDPNYKLKEKTFSKLLINKIYLISIIGHSISQLGLLIVYYFCIINQNDYYFKEDKNGQKKNRNIYTNDITIANSYIFFFNSIQCLSLVFMLNYFSLSKQSVFKSRIFTIYLIIICLTLTQLLSLDNYGLGIINIPIVKFIELNNEGTNSQNSRIILFFFCLGTFAISMIWEFFLNWFFSINYTNYLKNEDEKVNKKLKNSYRQKSMKNMRQDI